MQFATDKWLGLPIVVEIMSQVQVDVMVKYVDVLQVGARNMQNYQLLEEVGRTGMPVLLKRGLSATFEEWLLSAEYIINQGNPNVILCERGIRTFETATRNTLDISAIPIVKQLSHLPIIVDPSHGTGRRDKVAPMARAAPAASPRAMASSTAACSFHTSRANSRCCNTSPMDRRRCCQWACID